MSIENTQFLSHLSSDEIKTVFKMWPNPLTPLAFMMGGLAVMLYGLLSFNQSNVESRDIGMLIGSVAAFLVLTFGSGIYAMIKLSKARKALNTYAQQKSLPSKELFKEFKKNLKHIKTL